jgi:hypothetical protein
MDNIFWLTSLNVMVIAILGFLGLRLGAAAARNAIRQAISC